MSKGYDKNALTVLDCILMSKRLKVVFAAYVHNIDTFNASVKRVRNMEVDVYPTLTIACRGQC